MDYIACLTQIQLGYSDVKMCYIHTYVITLLHTYVSQPIITSYLQTRYNPMSQLHSYMTAALQPYVAARLQDVTPLC